MPGAELAEAFIRLRTDASAIKGDVEKGMKQADGAAAGKRAGGQFGEGFSSSASASIKKNSGKIALAGTAAFAAIGVASIKMAGDFQAGMTRLVTSAGETRKNLDLVSAGVLKLAVSTGTSTAQLSSGLYTIESAGFHGAAGLNVLKAASQGARAEGAQLGTVADAVTTVLTDYHLQASDAAKATSALVATVQSGKTNMELLSGSLSRVLPTAAALHVSFPQIAGDIATLTAHGVSARLATQDLNSVLVALSAPSDKAAKAMQSVGLTSEQVSEDIGRKGLTATLQELSAAFLKNAGPDGQLLLATLKGLPPAAQSAANAFLAGAINLKTLNKETADLSPLQQDQLKNFVKLSSSATGVKQNYVAAMTAMLGGTRGLGVALQLTGQNAKTASADTATIAAAYKNAGLNVAGWNDVQKTFNFRLSQFQQEGNVTAITLGEKLLPAATGVLSFLSAHESVVVDLAKDFAIAGVAVTGLAAGIKTVSVITSVVSGFTSAGRAVATFTSSALAAAAVEKGMSDKALAAAAAQRVLAVSTLATGDAEATAAAAGTKFAVSADGTAAAVGGLNVAQKGAALGGAALTAIPLSAWATAGAAAAVALGVAIATEKNNLADLTGELRKQFQATGYNISGYQKMAAALDTQGKVQEQVARGIASGQIAYHGLYGNLAAVRAETTLLTAAQQQSKLTASQLVLQLDSIQQSYGITRTQAEELAAHAGVTATNLALTGTAGEKSLQKVLAWAQGAGRATLSAYQWSDATNNAAASLAGLDTGLLASQGDVIGWQSAQANATAALHDSTAGMSGNSAAAISARGAVLQATQAAAQLAMQQLNVDHNARGASKTLQDQITWLQSTGDHSKFTADEIYALRQQLAKLQTKKVDVLVHGDGTFSVAGAATYSIANPKGGYYKNQAAAAGMLVTGGTPGRDSVLVSTMPGELIVPTSLVRSGAVDHLRGMIPGFAAGGIVPSYSGAPGKAMGGWAVRDYNATTALTEQAVATAAARQIRAMQQAIYAGGPAGGAAAANAALARHLMPSWGSGSAWSAWNSVAMAESGWNQYARNPASGAYGIPQALPASKMGSAANPPQSNPAAQIEWMVSYIEGTYGTPQAAWAHEQALHWYGTGTSSAAPGWAVVGERGPELVRMGGGEQVVPPARASGAGIVAPLKVTPADDSYGLRDLAGELAKVLRRPGGPLIGTAVVREEADAALISSRLQFLLQHSGGL